MAESVVSFAVETIGKLLIDEAKFLWSVEGKVEDLDRELRLVQGLLRDADAKREHNQVVAECVAQLRDFAYDAEDVIERYILKAAPKEGKNIIKAYACFMAKCSCGRVHGVGTEIEGLKSRISDIGRRMQNYGIQSVKEGERKQARVLMPKRTYVHFEEDFVGREDSIEELVKELLNDEKKRRVIFIWGMGGLGKTSLAKKVIAHDKVENNFDGFAWACISQEYHVKDILIEILVKLIPDQKERIMKMADHEVFKILYEIQQKKRCIVVLDDIWTKETWDSLRDAFPVKDTRSKLLITTRNRKVAEYIDPQGLFHEPRCLTDQESWDLLKKRAFLETKVGQSIAGSQLVEGIARQAETEGQLPVITEDIKRLGHELLKKCGGLPLAIIVLGGLLAVNEWETVNKKINLHFDDKSDITKVLALSYDDLPWYLKPCFLYLANFPEDAKISTTKVLRMWIAEGFVLPNAYNEKREIQVEDVAEQYLMELVNRGMIQVQFNLSGNVKTCHLHDLMRDLCLSKALQENFLSILDIQPNNEMEDFSSSMAIKVKSTCKIRRLSLNMQITANGNMLSSVKSTIRTMLHLRTLMFFGNIIGKWESFHPIFIKHEFLRVLKLEDLIMMDGYLPESVGNLVHLRLLSLKESKFEGLPQSLGNLVCMEFLDLCMCRCMMVTIPNVLWKMRKLRYLHLPHRFVVKEKLYGDQKKLRLDTLKNLHTLRNFFSENCDVNDVDKLTNLQKLSTHGANQLEIIPQLAKFNLKHLQYSSFRFERYKHSFIDGEWSKMSSYSNSCKLSLFGKIEKFPEHKNLPQQLRKLVLVDSQLEEDPMPILEKLYNLVVLLLVNAFVGKDMVCSAEGFPQLKHLLLYKLKNLMEWRIAERTMPLLSRLGIIDCPELRAVPEGVPEGVHTYDAQEYSYDQLWETAEHRDMRCAFRASLVTLKTAVIFGMQAESSENSP